VGKTPRQRSQPVRSGRECTLNDAGSKGCAKSAPARRNVKPKNSLSETPRRDILSLACQVGRGYCSEGYTMPVSVNRGRWMLLFACAALVVSDALVISTYLLNVYGRIQPPFFQIELATRLIRFLLTILLVSLVYRGNRVAQWIAAGLLAWACAIGLRLIIVAPTDRAIFAAFLALMYGFFVWSIVGSPSVRAFLATQRERSQRQAATSIQDS
jgi:hypothetical protein